MVPLRSSPSARRRHRGAAAVLSVGVALVSAASAASAAAAPVTVTLGFDDGMGTRNDPAQILALTGAPGTFYVNTVAVQRATDDEAYSHEYLAWHQLEELQAAGHEIAGHTLHHTRLTPPDATVPEEESGDPAPEDPADPQAPADEPAPTPTDEEVRAEVCDDRATLRQHGFVARSFAYPFGRTDARASAIVRDCGYLSGRTTSAPTVAESLPPVDPYATEAFNTGGMSGEQMLGYVREAVLQGGGWVQFIFHDICDVDDALCNGTPDDTVTPRALRILVQGLADDPQVRVKTAGDVIGADAEAAPPAYPEVAPGGTDTQAVVVRNDGLTPLEVGEVGLDESPGPFRVVTDGCADTTVAPGSSCAVAVEFAPTATGTFTTQLTVRGNTDPRRTVVPLQGTSAAPDDPGGDPGGNPGGNPGPPAAGGTPGGGTKPGSAKPAAPAAPVRPPAPPAVPPSTNPATTAAAQAAARRARLIRARGRAYRVCARKSTRKARVACRSRVRVRYARLLRKVPAVAVPATRR